jgi:hypothetical protein
MIKKIWNLAQIAQAHGISREAVRLMWHHGQIDPPAYEDQAGRPFWGRLPEISKQLTGRPRGSLKGDAGTATRRKTRSHNK